MEQESSHNLSQKQKSRLSLVVPSQLVKPVKTALEQHCLLDKAQKIRSIPPEALKNSEMVYVAQGAGAAGDYAQGHCVPTTVPFDDLAVDITDLRGHQPERGAEHGHSILRDLLSRTGIIEYERQIGWVLQDEAEMQKREGTIPPRKPLLDHIVDHWLQAETASGLFANSNNGIATGYSGDKLQSQDLSGSVIYPPMLLLKPKFLVQRMSSQQQEQHAPRFPQLFKLICQAIHVTHIAVGGPVPVQLEKASPKHDMLDEKGPQPAVNVLRLPTRFTPLYGDFGPALTQSSQLSATDVEQAFWCSTEQNSVFQTWTPRYTMFSRGNISEKARILSLPSLTEKILKSKVEETSAVDLYAGIGYFAFSYAKAGVGRILCWELNGWSIEGLRRGARGNGWQASSFSKCHNDSDALRAFARGQEQLLVFEESNEHAASRINAIRDLIPPIRHVNCGYLPSSMDSWQTAVDVLDPLLGGWIHVHENIPKPDIESRQISIIEHLTRLKSAPHCNELSLPWKIACEHIERVKSYSPGVIHCVLDISIEPDDV